MFNFFNLNIHFFNIINIMINRIICFIVCITISLFVQAVPVKKGIWKTITLQNGKEVRAQLKGDEWFHFFEDEKGNNYIETDDGKYKKVSKRKMEKMRLENQEKRKKSIELKNNTKNANTVNQEFWLGADISGTTQLEAFGQQLCDVDGVVYENTALMKKYGLNAVRLRVWVNPRGGFSNQDDVLTMAKRAQYYRMPVMIDFHYSDWWADPAKQHIPAAWQYYTYDEMKHALAGHTEDVLKLLKNNKIDVKWVQVGNETTHGFLWPMGKAEDNMEQYAGLTKAGYDAVKKVYPDAKVIIHLDGGCDEKRYDFIFDGLKEHGVKWDIIGVSVYPYWDIKAGLETDAEGTIRDFSKNIRRMYEKYGTESMVVETGVEVAKPEEGKKILSNIIAAALNDCDGHCHGVFYWAPELEGHYPLGAFQNHCPTIIMDAFKEWSLKIGK